MTLGIGCHCRTEQGSGQGYTCHYFGDPDDCQAYREGAREFYLSIIEYITGTCVCCLCVHVCVCVVFVCACVCVCCVCVCMCVCVACVYVCVCVCVCPDHWWLQDFVQCWLKVAYIPLFGCDPMYACVHAFKLCLLLCQLGVNCVHLVSTVFTWYLQITQTVHVIKRHCHMTVALTTSMRGRSTRPQKTPATLIRRRDMNCDTSHNTL